MNNKLNAKILLIIVILVVPLSCLALAIASVFVGFGLTAATSASGPVDPEAVEAEIINIAAQYAETNDLATAQQQLADLNLPNTNQYISFMADRYIQENAGTDDPNTQHLFVLASALGVGTESMALALATPTPIPTDTPVPTDTPTVVAEEVVAEEMAAVEVAAAEDQQPTDTPEPTATPEPTRPPVDFVVAEAYLIPNPVYNSCPGAHQIYVTVVDVNGNPIDGATVEDTFRVVPPHVSGEKGPGKLEYDLWDNGFSLEVTKKADGSPATSEVTPKLSSWDEDIPDEWLVQANYCLDIADCVARKGHNQLYRGHYAYNVTFQKAY